MRGSAPAPQCKEKDLLTNLSGPRSSFILVYQSQLSIRGQGASMPLPARLESSKRCYWLCQTSGWPEWAGKNRSNLSRFLRPAAGRIFGFWVLGFGLREAHQKRCRRSRCGFIRAYSTPKRTDIDRPARMDRARIVAHDAPYDPWPSAMTVNEEIRAIQRKAGARG